ncbi:MAG: HAMP domain-containing histidine kinase [Marivita sp.]|uniref:sensor histidine kinase n=1 Tax=Marivita sp. TaxID=2003365 RepID=UPI0025C690BB|nr:HAMP domain-containing sensor histidine kinase [Marivita sp.]MCI5112832.1 HAMP domain-containing histidine kinase [Marivita sp.]
MSLRLRLALAGAVAILVALGLAALGLATLFAAHVERRAVAEMSVQLDQVLAGLERGPDGLSLARPPADPRFSQPYGGLYWQIEEGGAIQRSRSLWDTVLDLPADTLGDGAVHVHHLPGPEGANLLVLERSSILPARLGGGAVRAAVGMNASELDAARRNFMADLAPYLGLLALALITAGWAQLSVGLRPLRDLGARIAALRTGRAMRMGEDWPVELRPVAAEIDDLLTARDAETERARARAADLAHGLKTPLQALMGEAARLRGEGATEQAEGIEDTARAMRRTVDRELARARTATRAVDAQADPALVADRLIAVLRRTPDGAELDWRQGIAPGLSVALHEADLAEALGALAENAARHAKSTVAISAQTDGSHLLLSVADDGDGIPETRRAALMQRHARADETGTGLGLSIATDIAQAAGGDLMLTSAEPGLRATLRLPLVQQPARASVSKP